MVVLSKKNSGEQISLTAYINRLQESGRHYFLSHEIEEALGMTKASVSASLSRLAKKNRIKMVRRGFGIILSIDGKEPHPSSYIDKMMAHVGADYYVGLLSASAHWGASHQASMRYQILTNKIAKDIIFSRARVEFITKKEMQLDRWIERVSTSLGYFKVSSPELTAIDLIRFYPRCGHLNNVATILEELISRWDGRKMASLCLQEFVPTVVLQRLGYILEEILRLSKESSYVCKALEKRTPVQNTLVKLTEGKKMSDYEYNKKWKLYINTEVEVD